VICLAAWIVAGILEAGMMPDRVSSSGVALLNGCPTPEPCRYFRVASPLMNTVLRIPRGRFWETGRTHNWVSCVTERKAMRT
jgi:hypothetical protein